MAPCGTQRKGLMASDLIALIAVLLPAFLPAAPQLPVPRWKHLSSARGELPVPNGGRQQTACVVFDIDKDGASDIVVAERTRPPALIWIRHTGGRWEKCVIDATKQRPEAGGASHDIDGDGDLDLIIGGDAGSDQLWWYENPYPDFSPRTPWHRYTIKKGGGRAHHDQVIADFKGTGRPQLVFWNQGVKGLFCAEVPRNARSAPPWPAHEIFNYRKLRSRIKQEGAFACDVDSDGQVDLLAGQFFFKYRGGNRFQPIMVSDRPGRIAAGHFESGWYPQIVVAPGDGNGPLWYITCRGDPLSEASWKRRNLLNRQVVSGHTLSVGDVNGDGNLDIFCAEMHTPGHKEKCTAWLLLGDGKGHFAVEVLSVGVGHHDSRLADVNGDGRLDIVGKPYTWSTPRLDVWINLGNR